MPNPFLDTPPANKNPFLDAPDTAAAEKPKENKPAMYGRGQLPIPNSSQELITGQNVLDAAMMVPAMGTEGLALKGMGALENAATRAYPKVAQILGEGNVIPITTSAAKTAAAGGAGGTVYGAGTGRDIKKSAETGAVGSLAGKTLGNMLGEGYDAFNNFINKNAPEVINNKAIQKILRKFQKDEKGGGISADEAVKKVNEANKSGKPMILPDVAGSNVRGMAGSVARAPGPSKEAAQGFLNKRDAAAAERLEKDVDKYLATGSARQTVKTQAAKRSVEGKPLFEKAYQGGSMAPLEKQFEKTFQETAQKTSGIQKEIGKISPRVTMLQAKLSQTSNVYEQAALKKQLQAAQKELTEKQSTLAQAKMEEAQAHDALQKAQQDRSASAPGAVWNPRIQRLLELPEVKAGINKGIQLERLNSVADGRAFNATEFAITGTDKAGNPIVGKVPNMRLLASAKEGLDSLLEGKEMRDENTRQLTKLGVAVDKVRKSLLKELDEINPDYKTARESWAGDSQTMDAVRLGQKAFTENPEELAERIKEMTPSEKEFAKIGISDTIREKIGKTGFGGDEAKAIIKNPWMQKQMRPFFNSDKEFSEFVKSVTDERSMFESKTKLVGNSASAERLGDDAENLDIMKKAGIVKNLVSGHPIRAYQAMYEAWEASKFKDEKLNEAMAKLLFDPNISMDMLKPSVKTGEPAQSIVRKSAPFAGQAAGQFLTNKPLNQFVNQ